MDANLEYLMGDLAVPSFASKGQLGEASQAIAPILLALEAADTSLLPARIHQAFYKQLQTQTEQLRRSGLRRVIRITDPHLASAKNKNSLGFAYEQEASRQWRECEIDAAVLERYIDIRTGACMAELYDPHARLTLRQSRHTRAARKGKNQASHVYIREHCLCPSCGAPLTHIADNTQCPYCGALIAFHFTDWQLDGFYLDMHKASLCKTAGEAAGKAVTGAAVAGGKLAGWFADAYERSAKVDRRRGRMSYDSYLGGIVTVLLLALFLAGAIFLALPWYIRLALGLLAAGSLLWGAFRYLKATDQRRKKRKIVRYSHAYLRSCLYETLWKTQPSDHLADFTVDDIHLDKVIHTETTTTVKVTSTVIRKTLTPEGTIAVTAEDIPMAFSRARYPERKKPPKAAMEEKECPSCGANFSPDENHCCAYCGYGLKMENYVWRSIQP